MKRLDPGTSFHKSSCHRNLFYFLYTQVINRKRIHSAGSACGDANVELHGTLRAQAVPGHPGAAGHQP